MTGPLDGRQSMNWNVVFERGRTPWGHVYAFAFDAVTGVWIVIDPHLRWTRVFAVPQGVAFRRWVAGVAPTAEIYRLQGRGQAPLGMGFFCVGTVKRLVGLRSGALSPKGLKRDLLKAGARRVFHENQAAQGRPSPEVASRSGRTAG
jgi:hypothetical protein